jgi:hypothetical protein
MKYLVTLSLILSTCLFAAKINVKPESLQDPNDPTVRNRYYLGFGDRLSGFMGQEVLYDIKHTHDIFTTGIGGDYKGTKVQSSSGVRQNWTDLKGKITWDDLYLQYSSGHGYEQGLAIGIMYSDIADFVLSNNLKENVVFTMACHSGCLVEEIDRRKNEWANLQAQGRTLFVMASSRCDENSSTGPITDPEEPGGPDGSAGSAFGHALWKALIGHADANKDGYITLGEIVDYVVPQTQQIGGHTPVYTGVYNRDLKMVKVPPKEWIDAMERETVEGLKHLRNAK